MVPDNNNLARYLHEAAVAEIGDKYQIDGYQVTEE